MSKMRVKRSSLDVTSKFDKVIFAAMISGLLFSAILLSCICISAQTDTLDYTSVSSLINAPSITSPTGLNPVTATVVPETLKNATLVLRKPNVSILIPYTERGFNKSVEASIAWWMNPKFILNTSEYRKYLRASPEEKARNYSPDTRIFFDFITSNLDIALDKSTLGETLILYRGISGGIVNNIINNSEYIEPAFASTSYDVTVSLGPNFGTRTPDGYQNVLVLQRTEGKHALYINENQREFLLPRGLNWNVIKAVNVENLTVEANFPLISSGKDEDQFNKVRFIYIKERAEKPIKNWATKEVNPIAFVS